MIFSRRIYFIILAYILLILATSGTGIWLIASHTGYVAGSLMIICSFFQITALIKQLNTFNQKIRYFFDAIQDKDNTLYFPESNVTKEQEQLNRALNHINQLMLNERIENQKQEHFFRALLEEVPTGIIAWNSSGQIILSNNAALSLLACSQLKNRQHVEQLLKDKKNLSLSKKQIKLQHESLSLLSIKDIGTELSDKESESWSELTHVLTHEIMNTIAPILSLSQALGNIPNTNDKTTKGLKIIQSQCERLMDFTESFRHLSYLPRPEKKRFPVTTLINNLQELLQSDFSERAIRFTLQCQPASIIINGDENQLSQVFLNLLKNAMQALEEAGTGNISMKLQENEKLLLIQIEDDGPGIPADIQEKIFIPFFTTKSEGMGIGLSLCRQIIRQHDGYLFISESNPGKTVFSIELPINPGVFL